MTDTRFEPIDLPAGGVQMVDSYLHGVHLERRDRTEADPPGPTLVVGLAGQTDPEGQPATFAVILEAHIVAPFNEGQAIAELRCSVVGIFSVQQPEALDLGRFTSRESVVLIYPYLRASVGQIWRMSGIPMPPIPTLDTLSLLSVIDGHAGASGAPETSAAAESPRRRSRAKSSK